MASASIAIGLCAPTGPLGARHPSPSAYIAAGRPPPTAPPPHPPHTMQFPLATALALLAAAALALLAAYQPSSITCTSADGERVRGGETCTIRHGAAGTPLGGANTTNALEHFQYCGGLDCAMQLAVRECRKEDNNVKYAARAAHKGARLTAAGFSSDTSPRRVPNASAGLAAWLVHRSP